MSKLQDKVIQAEKEKICFFTAADNNNFNYAVTFWKSMTKFHSPKDIDMIFYTTMKAPKELAKLPKGIMIKDLTPYLEDPMFFYRQKPILSEELLNTYDLAVGFDSDQLILAPLDDVIRVKTYDVGCVINWNRFDEKYYSMVHQLPYVQPIEYFNCGLVAVRSKRFVHMWKAWCFSSNFDRSQYKEQDGLNILAHHANFNVWNFDAAASSESDLHWYGIISKGELQRAVVEKDLIVIPKGLGNTPFPPTKVVLHAVHMGGGNGAPKDNWAAFFSEKAMLRVKEIMQ